MTDMSWWNSVLGSGQDGSSHFFDILVLIYCGGPAMLCPALIVFLFFFFHELSYKSMG